MGRGGGDWDWEDIEKVMGVVKRGDVGAIHGQRREFTRGIVSLQAS